MGKKMYALFEMGMQLFSKKNSKNIKAADAFMVSAALKFFAQLSFKKARIPLLKRGLIF